MHRRSSTSNSRLSSVGPLRVKHDNDAPSSSRGSGIMRRTSGAGGRHSGVGLGNAGPRKSTSKSFGLGNNKRPTSGYGRGNMGRGIQRETRPLSDKTYMQKEIRDIIEFLQENGYPHQLSVKQLMSPTNKEFIRIFQYIYNFLDEDFAVSQKFEEEIPAKLKELKYPFPMSKSSMLTPGSPHAWPHVLGALHWLLDLVKYTMNTDVNKLLFSEDSDGLESQGLSRFKFDYQEGTYAEFMSGQDRFDEYERRLRDAIQLKSYGGEMDMGNLQAEEQRLTAELQELETQQSRIPALQEQVKAMTIDSERFSSYLVSLREHKKTHDLKVQEAELKLGQTEMEMSELDREASRVQYLLEHQELSAKDVERMQTELRQASSSLDQVERENRALDQECWAEERGIAKKQEELEKKVNEYNSLARKLKLIPADAENAHGIDYELKLNFHSIYSQQSPMLDFVSTIKPALVQLKKNINSEVHKLHSHSLDAEEELDQVKEMTESKGGEIKKLEAQVQRLEKEINAFKEKSHNEVQVLTDRLLHIEEQKASMLASGSSDVAKAQEQVRQMQARYEEAVQLIKNEEENYDKFLTQACTMILEHKTKIQNHVSGLVGMARGYLEQIQNMELPKPPDAAKYSSKPK